jgi:hypothetical protein
MARIIPIDGGKKLRMPEGRDRIAVIGPTGSGKTYAAIWHLSLQNFDVKPWIIIDPKIDDNIAQIEGVEEIDLYADKLPSQAGLYIAHPVPSQMDDLDDYFMRVWEQENIGLYCDEGYMNADGDGFLACLTQGRSKRIPMIILCQRPAFISRFVWSESQFFQAFDMTHEDDRKKLNMFMRGRNASIGDKHLPEFHSWYFDVKQQTLFAMKPVPKLDATLDVIANKLEIAQQKPQRRYL